MTNEITSLDARIRIKLASSRRRILAGRLWVCENIFATFDSSASQSFHSCTSKMCFIYTPTTTAHNLMKRLIEYPRGARFIRNIIYMFVYYIYMFMYTVRRGCIHITYIWQLNHFIRYLPFITICVYYCIIYNVNNSIQILKVFTRRQRRRRVNSLISKSI